MSQKSLGDAFGSIFGATADAAGAIGTVFETVADLAVEAQNGVALLGTAIAVAQDNANNWREVNKATGARTTKKRIDQITVECAQETAELYAAVDKKCSADPVFAKYFAAAFDSQLSTQGKSAADLWPLKQAS